MKVQQDFQELLELLNNVDVKYMIVGGYALAFHGAPRYTGDIDIYIKPDRGNAELIIRALEKFGFGSLGLTVEDFTNPDNVVQLGVPPVRIDIMTSISGLDWEDAEKGCVDGKYGDVVVRYIGLNEFVINKRKTGRKKDISDLEALGLE